MRSMVWYGMVITSPILQHLLIRTAANAVSSNGGTNNPTNNQRYVTTFSFINHFKSALHVSGDKFAHPQEHSF